MPGKPLLYLITVVSFMALYAPQPLQPLLADKLDTGMEQTAFLVSVSLLFTGLAPLFLSWLVDKYSVRAFYVLLPAASLSVWIYILPLNYYLIIGGRILLGITAPLIFACVIKNLTTGLNHRETRKAMSRYVAATVTGGVLSRLLSGSLNEYIGLTNYAFILSALVILPLPFLGHPRKQLRAENHPPHFAELFSLLRDRRYRNIYILIFLTFFVFSGTFNFLPYRVVNILGDRGTFLIGAIYVSYLAGIASALGFGSYVHRLGNDRLILIGLYILFILIVVILAVPGYWATMITMFFFCLVFFTIHSLLSGLVNTISEKPKGLVNGMYICFYYLGGAAGGFLPGFAYDGYGWQAFQAVMIFVLLICTGLILFAGTFRSSITTKD